MNTKHSQGSPKGLHAPQGAKVPAQPDVVLYRLAENPDDGIHILAGPEDHREEIVCEQVSPDHAAFLLKACNEFPSLISQRDRLARALADLRAVAEAFQRHPKPQDPVHQQLPLALEQAGALLQEIAGGKSEGHSCPSGAE